MSYHLQPHHIATAETFVAKAWRNGGLASLDLDRFWADNELASADPFGKTIPQVPLGAICNWECVFAEMGVEQDWRRWHDDIDWRQTLAHGYDIKAREIVGRPLLGLPAPGEEGVDWWIPTTPVPGKLNDVFEMAEVWDTNSQSYWLIEAATTEDELVALLDRVDERDIRSVILPANWDELKAAGKTMYPYRAQRGPVTFATSMVGVEFLLLLILDNPDLAARLRDTILRVMREIGEVIDDANDTPANERQRGWYWLDDNCYLLNPAMYEFFALPILQGMFETYAPNPADHRGQHSDSAMGHLLPLLARCGLHDCNFGPTLTVAEIRQQMPTTIIQGQLAPFTYSRNEEVNMVAEFLRDMEQARDDRGLLFATAGSINNGSRLTGMRLLMAAIQEFGRYD
jgi:uroporphyrinogen decarboxylase